MPTSFSRAGIFTSEALQPPEKYKQNFDISSEGPSCKKLVATDHLHYRLNFDLDKSRQKFHHSLKEHHKISNIPKFRCEML
jgi:hypothetical protein